MSLIDSHCHIDFPIFDQDRQAILHRCQQLTIDTLFVPGVTAATWDRLLTVCQQSPQLHPALGMHPMFMAEHHEQHIPLLREYVAQHSPIAIGEIGLDFYIPNHDKQSQSQLFAQQLAIAKEFELPVLLHVRKAHDQTLALLKKYSIKSGIVHAFSGSEQQAQAYIKQGLLLGFGGAITHNRATRLQGLVAKLPLTAIALETDAPDMPLAEQAEQRNSPENVALIAKKVAELRQKTIEIITKVTTNNVRMLLK
ncbi:DNAase [Methylophaga sp. 41_12_T18]|nr:DNAase [Methylophaga sp. 41_12_T18]